MRSRKSVIRGISMILVQDVEDLVNKSSSLNYITYHYRSLTRPFSFTECFLSNSCARLTCNINFTQSGFSLNPTTPQMSSIHRQNQNAPKCTFPPLIYRVRVDHRPSLDVTLYYKRTGTTEGFEWFEREQEDGCDDEDADRGRLFFWRV